MVIQKKHPLFLVTIALSLFIVISGSRAGDSVDEKFAAGLAAFDAGDYQDAFDNWRPLAITNFVDAQVALAAIYEQGLGRPVNLEKAIFWYRRAAILGNPIAQIALAEKHERGIGLQKDIAMALAWYAEAANNGNRYAVRERDRLLLLVPWKNRKLAQ